MSKSINCERVVTCRRMGGLWQAYTVCDNGTVFKEGKDEPMKPYRKSNGYLCVSLKDTLGIRHHMLVHRLVAMMFVDNPDNKEEVDHKDGDKDNNHKDNLQWVTHSENHLAFRRRQRESGMAVTPEQILAMQEFDSGKTISEIAELWDCSRTAVGKLLRRGFRNCGRQWEDQRRKRV